MGPMSEDEELLALVGVPAKPDELAVWCWLCQRWHQNRERPIECRHDGCRRLTGNAHGLCEEHLPKPGEEER